VGRAVALRVFAGTPPRVMPGARPPATAAAARRYLLGLGPLFPVAAHPLFIGPAGLLGCAIAGLLAGVLSAILTQAV
jgi:hypothetical protein